MLKQYNISPATANTDTDLVTTIATGYVFIMLTLQIHAVTAASVEIKLYNSSGTLAQTVPLSISVGDTAILDHKIVVPAGGKIAVQSSVTDTTFTAHGNLGAE